METQMTPGEALQFLDQACASVAMGRPAHVKGIQAVAILKGIMPEGPENNGDKPKTAEEKQDAATE